MPARRGRTKFKKKGMRRNQFYVLFFKRGIFRREQEEARMRQGEYKTEQRDTSSMRFFLFLQKKWKDDLKKIKQ